MDKAVSDFISQISCNHPFYAKLDDGCTVFAIKTSKNEVLRTASRINPYTREKSNRRIDPDRIVECSELGE